MKHGNKFLMKNYEANIYDYSWFLEENVTCYKHHECWTILESECIKRWWKLWIVMCFEWWDKCHNSPLWEVWEKCQKNNFDIIGNLSSTFSASQILWHICFTINYQKDTRKNNSFLYKFIIDYVLFIGF